MKIAKTTYQKVWVKLSEALLDFYIMVILHRNGHVVGEDMQLAIEYGYIPIGLAVKRIKLDTVSKKKLYRSVKSRLLKDDLGYRYVAKTNAPIIYQGVVAHHGPQKQDTARFWDIMDHHVMNFI